MLVKIGSTADIAQGQMRVFDIAGVQVGIASVGGRMLAFGDLLVER